MVNDGTSNALVYLDGEQVRWLLDLNPKQWNKLEEHVGQVGKVNLSLVIDSMFLIFEYQIKWASILLANFIINYKHVII